MFQVGPFVFDWLICKHLDFCFFCVEDNMNKKEFDLVEERRGDRKTYNTFPINSLTHQHDHSIDRDSKPNKIG